MFAGLMLHFAPDMSGKGSIKPANIDGGRGQPTACQGGRD
jgi:hypothetical protein